MIFALLFAGCAPHIDPLTEPLPRLPRLPRTDDVPLKVCWVEFAVGNFNPGITTAGGEDAERFYNTDSGLVLIHGDQAWLLDGGAGVNVEADLEGAPAATAFFVNRVEKPKIQIQTVAEALERVGVEKLEGAIASHAHFDHLGGLVDLPDVPIWAPATEWEALEDLALPGTVERLGNRGRVLDFPNGTFLNYEASKDLFGDGSVILVPMPGHTPGSVGAFISVEPGKTFFHIGDTTWVTEGVEKLEHKAKLALLFDGEDVDQAANQIARVNQIWKQIPDLQILPAHDRPAWDRVFGSPGCIER